MANTGTESRLNVVSQDSITEENENDHEITKEESKASEKSDTKNGKTMKVRKIQKNPTLKCLSSNKIFSQICVKNC